MRTKKEINEDMKENIADMDMLIEESLQDEQVFEDARTELEEHAKALKAEKAYEDTLAGQIDEHIANVREQVDILLDELEQKTGVKFIIVSADCDQDESNS